MQATMTSKGQLTVPKAVRDRLGLKPGDKVEFRQDGAESVTLVPVRRVPLEGLIGCLSHLANSPPMTDEEQEEAIGRMLVEDDERIMREYRESIVEETS